MANDVRKISLADFDALPLTEVDFAPDIYEVAGLGVMYDDGRMSASVDIEEENGLRVLSISTWDCEYPGKGYSRVALEWLRARFDLIVVSGAGELDEYGVGDSATIYWLHMHEKGLVDVILLDDGAEITPEVYSMPAVPTVTP